MLNYLEVEFVMKFTKTASAYFAKTRPASFPNRNYELGKSLNTEKISNRGPVDKIAL
jgi:hypothetical protein